MEKSIDGCPDAIKNLIKEVEHFYETMQPIIQKGLELSISILKNIDSLDKSIVPISFFEIFEKEHKLQFKLFGEILNAFNWLAPKYVSKDQYDIYVFNARQHGKSGWGIHPDFPYNAATLNSDEFQLLIEKYIENIDINIDSCLKAIKEEIESCYESVIDEASICFKNQCYRACCSLLLSQIDRIFQSFAYKQYKYKQIYKADIRNKLDKELDEYYDITEHDIYVMLLWVSLKEIFDIIYENVSFEQYDKGIDSKKINRHCIQHGYSLHSFSKCDCFQISTILYLVINVVNGWDAIHAKSLNFMKTLVKDI